MFVPEVFRASGTGITNSPIKVVLFASFYGGKFLLQQLAAGPHSAHFEIAGVVTDDPARPYSNARNRLWKHPHTAEEESMVGELAERLRIPVYKGKIRDPDFVREISQNWKPDLCLMATFGQRITPELIKLPAAGFFNFHHSYDDGWPSYPGPNPIGQMQADGRKYLVMNVHSIDESFDAGQLIARSPRMVLPADADPAEVHRRTWPQLEGFFNVLIEREVLSRQVNVLRMPELVV